MDKLEPIIRHRFWILFGLVVPMVLYGFFSANGALKSAAETRESEIEGTKGGISKGFEPNEAYTKNLKAINERYAEWVDEELVKLWEKQHERMTWPVAVAKDVPDEFMGEFNLDTLLIYKGEYKNVMQKLVEYAQPVVPERTATLTPPTWKEKLILAGTLPSAQFGQLAITSEEMWNAQIDVWLTRLLLDSIRTINEDKDTVTESILRRIDRISLFGGDGSPVLGGSSGGGGGSGEMEDMYSDMGPTGGSSGAAKTSVSFSPAQEFGLGADASSQTRSTESMYDDEGGLGSGGGQAAAVRYIAESEGAPYLERGFYLSVIMMQSKIPDFLVELTNSPWPTRVTRFHIGANPYRTEKRVSPGMGGDYASQFGYDQESMYDSESSGSALRGAGGRGMMGGAPKSDFGGMATGLPEFATGAMNHPDLVQLDVVGVITLFRQPTELIAKMEEKAAAAAAETGAPATETPVEESEMSPEEAAENFDPAAPEPATADPAAPEPAADTVEPVTDDGTAPSATDTPTPAGDATESSNTPAPEPDPVGTITE